MTTPLKVLIVEDSKTDTELLIHQLRWGGYDITHARVESADAMAKALEETSWDLVISDNSMPQFSAIAALNLLGDKGIDIPFIVVSGTMGGEFALSAMRAGAQDYILKTDLTRLVPTVQRELKEAKERRGRKEAEEALSKVKEELELLKTLQSRAIRDPLTGLYNRRYLEEALERDIQRAKRKNSSVGLIMADLDFFKKFNDTWGHDAGDTLLKEVARVLKSSVRVDDLACRYGGEEFLLVLPDAELEDIQKKAHQILEGTQRLKITHQGVDLGPVTLSIGVSIFPGNGETPETLIKSADLALYEAKEKGRDRVVIASPQKKGK